MLLTDSPKPDMQAGKNNSMKNNVKEFIQKVLQEYQSPGLPIEFVKEFEKIKTK
jgi:hypothetical protein